MARPHPISEDRIRERAYLLWIEEGQPQGKSAEHWEKARELLALETEGDPKLPKKRRPSVARKSAKRRAM